MSLRTARPTYLTRRSLLGMAAAIPFLRPFAAFGADTPVPDGVDFAKPYPFDFDRLKARARALAARVYDPPRARVPDILERLGYLAHRDIAFKPERSLWNGSGGPFPIRLYHLGRHYKLPVNVHLVEAGQAREILYAPDLFAFGERAAFAEALPANLGFAGFRAMGSGEDDWLSYLGATYFRSTGPEGRYGVYARGLAVNTGLRDTREEFPVFSGFWLEPVEDRDDAMTVYALAEGPSVTGAFRMRWEKRGAMIADVTAALYVRRDTERLGIAPLNTMYWFGSDGRHTVPDWRRAVHNSDGLSIWTGSGERLWRPLCNPPSLQTNWFFDRAPKGFGLMQRTRGLGDFLDDRRRFDKRPSLWVEPQEDWGEGAVQLVEIPTDEEYSENVVAYWLPRRPAAAGDELTFRYRLHWTAEDPFPPDLARVVATRIGQVGSATSQSEDDRCRFVVDFAGGPLDGLGDEVEIAATVTAADAPIDAVRVVALPGNGARRLYFDADPVGLTRLDLRAVLHRNGEVLTEAWVMQYPL